MIKVIAFDLDGVLLECKTINFEALNEALAMYAPEFLITEDELYGLPSREKLVIKGVPEHLHEHILLAKQEKTLNKISYHTRRSDKLIFIFSALIRSGYKISVASNSVRKTVEHSLRILGIFDLVEFIISNEDVSYSKPHPQIYLRVIDHFGIKPKELLIVEDSYIGKISAINSCAKLCPVSSINDVTLDKILSYANKPDVKQKFIDDINVVIPMAGLGSRFNNTTRIPKPLINVCGTPMIQRVVESLNIDAKFTFIVQKSHYDTYKLESYLNSIAPNCNIIQIDGVTDGTARTVLLAKKHFSSDRPMIISNSDQIVNFDIGKFIYSMHHVDAGMLTFTATEPRWPFARCEGDVVTEVAEKNPISDIAACGIYYLSKGRYFVKYANQMIAKNIRVNGEFYVCPIFNQMLLDNKRVRRYHVASEDMVGFGTPEDLKRYLEK